MINRTLRNLAGIVSLATSVLSETSFSSETNQPALTNLYVSNPIIFYKIKPNGETNRVMLIEAHNTTPGKKYSLLSAERMPILPYGVGNLEQVWKTNTTSTATTNKLTFLVPYEQKITERYYTLKED